MVKPKLYCIVCWQPFQNLDAVISHRQEAHPTLLQSQRAKRVQNMRQVDPEYK